jgi:hypothetical protein
MLAFSDMSQVIYARVSDVLKDAVDVYAEERGVTLTAAVSDLIERGLTAASDERSVVQLTAKLARTEADKARLDADLRVATGELSALKAFADRAAQTVVGKCPSPACGMAISGLDLLGAGRCRRCEQPFLDLLAPRSTTSTLDEREFGFIFGALGAVLVGAAILGAKGK